MPRKEHRTVFALIMCSKEKVSRAAVFYNLPQYYSIMNKVTAEEKYNVNTVVSITWEKKTLMGAIGFSVTSSSETNSYQLL